MESLLCCAVLWTKEFVNTRKFEFPIKAGAKAAGVKSREPSVKAGFWFK
jgi:hypothetical protein